MEAEDLLSQLADIHLPAGVSLWPPAPGWWLLAMLLLGLLAQLARAQFRNWQRRQRLAHALAELARAGDRWFRAAATQRNEAGLQLLQDINSLLKRVALVHFPASDVASLSGQAWLHFLDTHGAAQGFTTGPGRVLGDGEYRRVFEADADALLALARQWITRQYLAVQDAAKPARSTTMGSTAA